MRPRAGTTAPHQAACLGQEGKVVSVGLPDLLLA